MRPVVRGHHATSVTVPAVRLCRKDSSCGPGDWTLTATATARARAHVAAGAVDRLIRLIRLIFFFFFFFFLTSLISLTAFSLLSGVATRSLRPEAEPD